MTHTTTAPTCLSPWLNLPRTPLPTKDAAGAPTATPAFCHLDPLPDNFVRDGERMWLIDYEYAAAGQPWMDLAILSMGCELSADAEARLLSAYLQQPSVDAQTMRRFSGVWPPWNPTRLRHLSCSERRTVQLHHCSQWLR